MEVQEYLASKGYDFTITQRPSGLTAIMNCPKCGDREKKFGISLVNGAFSCLRKNHCGWTGGYADFQRFHGDKPRRIVGQGDFRTTPKEYEKPKGNPSEADDAVYGFFKGRGISATTVDKLRIGKLRTAIAFRYYENGELVNVKYRGIEEKKFSQEKNAKPILYGMDAVPEESQELIICEGEIDCLSFHEYGYSSVVSIPSGATDLRWITVCWEWLERFTKIYLSYDMDDAGREMVEKVAKRLGDYRVYDLKLPMKDLNECLVSGVSREEISRCLITAVGYDRDELKPALAFTDKVVSRMIAPGQFHGRPTGFRFLDDTLKGWRDGEVTVWTGMNSSGKTTFLLQLVVQEIFNAPSAGQFLPVCIGSFEMRPEVLLNWGVLQARYTGKQGKSWVDAAPTESEVRRIMADAFSDVYIVDIKDRVDEDLVFDVFEFAVKKFGCRVFVIDSLMRISLSDKMDKLEGQLKFMDRVSKFASTYGAHIHLVAHPRKAENDQVRPDRVAVKGASEITDIADNVISLYRYSDEQRQKAAEAKGIPMVKSPDTALVLHKNRLEGKCGECRLLFDFDHKIFREV